MRDVTLSVDSWFIVGDLLQADCVLAAAGGIQGKVHSRFLSRSNAAAAAGGCDYVTFLRLVVVVVVLFSSAKSAWGFGRVAVHITVGDKLEPCSFC